MTDDLQYFSVLLIVIGCILGAVALWSHDNQGTVMLARFRARPKVISNGPGVTAWLSLVIGIPIAFEELYPDLEYDDPMGMRFIVPCLCFGGFFLAVWARDRFEAATKDVVMWIGMIGAVAFGIFRLTVHFEDIRPGFWVVAAFVLHLCAPVVAWGWQIYAWGLCRRPGRQERQAKIGKANERTYGSL